MDGALVYFHPGEGIEPSSIGRAAVVETKDGQKLLRTIKRGYDRGMFSATNLGSNSKMPDQLALVSAYPVQWMRFWPMGEKAKRFATFCKSFGLIAMVYIAGKILMALFP